MTNMAPACNFASVRDSTSTEQCVQQRDDCLVDRSYGWHDFGDEARSNCLGISERDGRPECAAKLGQLRQCYLDRWELLSAAAESATCDQPGKVSVLDVPPSCSSIVDVCEPEVRQALRLTDGSY